MKQITTNQVSYYQFEAWADVKHGFFTRAGGYSESPWNSLNVGGTLGDDPDAVRRNHALMYAALNVNKQRACTTWLVHGVDVVAVHGPVEGRRWLAKADGMITHFPDTPLVMRYADCTPLMFHDPTKQVIGIAHAGWRGTVAGMGRRMVEALQQTYGCQPQDIHVGIGPCISRDRYQVGEEVVGAVQDYFGTVEGLIVRDPDDGTAYFDLVAANRLDLQRAGVHHIDESGLCTATKTDEFYSHRAEKGQTGRFGAIISL